MTKNIYLITIIILFSGCHQKSTEQQWSIKATYYESCSCNAPCPCPFGLPMTNSFCKLNSLLEVHEGQFNNTDLKGVKVILSGFAGKWGEYYFSEATTNKQKHSIENILKTVNITGFDTILTSKKTKINIEKEDGNITFSTFNINVSMSMVRGKNGNPVVIQNLSKKVFENYIPYLSHKNIRTSSNIVLGFSFEKKAGFTSEWNLTNDNFK